MARTSLTDYLQNYPFWLMDIAPIEPLALPLFTPLLGFSAITAPEITVEIQDITEANWFFKRKVVKGADTSPMTLMRAAKWYDADFYKWMMAALMGDTGGMGGSLGAFAIGGASPRRDLLLVHFLSRSPLAPGVDSAAVATAGVLALQGTATAMTATSSSVTNLGGAGLSAAALGTAAAIGTSIGFSAVGKPLGPFEFAPRIPAKAWMLYGCVPSRYKAAGDLDATDGGVSIQELEIAVESWDELSLGTVGGAVAMGLAIADAAG